jgi:hypothetical protein
LDESSHSRIDIRSVERRNAIDHAPFAQEIDETAPAAPTVCDSGASRPRASFGSDAALAIVQGELFDCRVGGVLSGNARLQNPFRLAPQAPELEFCPL